MQVFNVQGKFKLWEGCNGLNTGQNLTPPIQSLLFCTMGVTAEAHMKT